MTWTQKINQFLPSNIKSSIAKSLMEELKKQNYPSSLKEQTTSSFSTFSAFSGLTIDQLAGNYVGPTDRIPDEIINRMRWDYQMNLGSMYIKLPIISADNWSVECESPEIASFIETVMWNVWRRLMETICIGLDYGRSPHEMIWAVDDSINFEYKDDDNNTIKKTRPGWVISEFKELFPSEYIGEKINGNWFISASGGVRSETLPPDKSFYFTNSSYWGNPYGESIFKAAYQPWYWSYIVTQSMLRYLERCGTPIPRAATISKEVTLQNGTKTDSMTLAMDALNNMIQGKPVVVSASEDANGELHPNILIDYLEDAKQAAPQFVEVLNYLNIAKLRGMVIPEMALTQTGSTGSYASVAQYGDMFLRAEESRINTIYEAVSNQVLPWIVQYNFGENAPKAKIISGGLTDKTRDVMIEALKLMLSNQTYKVQKEFLESQFNIPLEQVNQIPVENPAESKPLEFISPEIKDMAESITINETPKWHRDLNDIEKTVIGAKLFAVYDSQWTTVENGFIKTLDEILKQQMNELALNASKAIGTENPALVIGELKAKYSGKIESAYKDYLTSLYKIGQDQVKGELDLSGSAARQETLEYLAQRAKVLTESQIAEIEKRVKLNALQAWSVGKTADEVKDFIIEDLASFNKTKTVNVAQTESSDAINTGRHDAAKQLGENNIAAAMYSAILDGRQCPLCASLDGKIVDIKSPDYASWTPPQHQRCRCIWIYLTKDMPVENRTPNWTPVPESVAENRSFA